MMCLTRSMTWKILMNLLLQRTALKPIAWNLLLHLLHRLDLLLHIVQDPCHHLPPARRRDIGIRRSVTDALGGAGRHETHGQRVHAVPRVRGRQSLAQENVPKVSPAAVALDLDAHPVGVG